MSHDEMSRRMREQGRLIRLIEEVNQDPAWWREAVEFVHGDCKVWCGEPECLLEPDHVEDEKRRRLRENEKK